MQEFLYGYFVISCLEMGIIMCDVKKYSKMFEDMKQLQPEDTLQLVLEAKDKEERDFFELVGNFLMQKKQKQVIERNLF